MRATRSRQWLQEAYVSCPRAFHLLRGAYSPFSARGGGGCSYRFASSFSTESLNRWGHICRSHSRSSIQLCAVGGQLHKKCNNRDPCFHFFLLPFALRPKFGGDARPLPPSLEFLPVASGGAHLATTESKQRSAIVRPLFSLSFIVVHSPSTEIERLKRNVVSNGKNKNTLTRLTVLVVRFYPKNKQIAGCFFLFICDFLVLSQPQ